MHKNYLATVRCRTTCWQTTYPTSEV